MGEVLFYTYLSNTLNITIFVLLFLLLEPLLKKYYSVVCLYRFWFVLLIGLLIPLRFTFADSLFLIKIPQISVVEEHSNEAEETSWKESNVTASNLTQPVSQTSQEGTTLSMNHSNLEHAFKAYLNHQLIPSILRHINIGNWIHIIWMLGVISLLLYKGVQYHRYRMQLKRFLVPLIKADVIEELNLCVTELERQYRIGSFGRRSRLHRTQIYLCSAISSPMTIGVWNPKILLPDETYIKKDLHFLLLHELVHVWRRDSQIKLIQLLVISLNWYNPLCYVLSRRLDQWCEVSCDSIVLQKATKSDRMEYSRLLLQCAAMQPKLNVNLLMSFYGGKKNMKQRIQSILNHNNKRTGRLLLILFIGIVSTTAIVSIINHKDVSTSELRDTELLENMASPETDGIADMGGRGNTVSVPNNSQEELLSDEISLINNNPIDQNESSVSDEAENADDLRNTVVKYAIEAEGTPFIWGGNNLKDGVDSSGFVQAVYKKFDINLSRVSRDQIKECREVSLKELLPGDLIFYTTTSDNTVNHVSIYIGDDQVIHAKNAKSGVVIDKMDYRPIYSAGRVITD
ncbi:C40 family peptidase [Lachnospiraceae bacterium MD1]|uniref:C40 family peptidase n=1 Tax=Variimorphobacter saccharofermentans TaxID=2755051 RepID=A0A839JYA6_9FIRM|nr:M56 family metallopeptidase [Variimorphobacter saccharofermentans]MBB2181461.1 C40 family peptidase [Variimorphobacter saccharofermentans]